MSSAELVTKMLELVRCGHIGDALRFYEGLTSSDRQLEAVARCAAAVFAQSGDIPRARALIDPFLVDGGSVDKITLILAVRLAISAKDRLGAFNLAVRCLKADPEQILNWQQLTRTAIDARRAREGLEAMLEIRIQPWNSPELAICYATLVTRGLSLAAGRIVFEQLLVRWPNHPVASLVYRELMCRSFPADARGSLAAFPCHPGSFEFNAISVRAALEVPAFYHDKEDAAFWRSELIHRLAEMDESLEKTGLDAWERVSYIEALPSWLIYQEGDVREAWGQWGKFLSSVVAPAASATQTTRALLVRPSAVPRVTRVGFVSNRVIASSAARYFNPWLDVLIRRGLDVRLYTLGRKDSMTESYGAQVSRWMHDESGTDIKLLANAIASDENDVIVYPEISASAGVACLAAMRLAPTQCAGFGVPCTTGLPTIDVFFTPDASENAEAELLGHYFEQNVVRLPGFGTPFIRPPQVTVASRAELGLPLSGPLLLAAQSPVKWTPSFVDTVIAILKRLPQAMLVIFSEDPMGTIGQSFDSWLRARFEASGLQIAKHVFWCSRSDHVQFLARTAHCAASLDTFGFGAGATALDAICAGVPMVTIPGEYLRNRQAAAMLRYIGVTDTVVDDTTKYIDMAVRLCSDPEFRQQQSSRLLQGAHRLFGDHTGTSAFADTIERFAKLQPSVAVKG